MSPAAGPRRLSRQRKTEEEERTEQPMTKPDELHPNGIQESQTYSHLRHEAERARAEALIRGLRTLKRMLKSG